jgi:hypothetical protein
MKSQLIALIALSSFSSSLVSAQDSAAPATSAEPPATTGDEVSPASATAEGSGDEASADGVTAEDPPVAQADEEAPAIVDAPAPAATEPVSDAPAAAPAAAEASSPTAEELWSGSTTNGSSSAWNNPRPPSADGRNPLTRRNRNEVSLFVGRLDTPVKKADRTTLGTSDEHSIPGASIGARFRSAMGLGGEIAYVTWNTSNTPGTLDLSADGFDAAVRYAWDPIGFISLYGQVGGGGRWVDLELNEQGASLSDNASAWSAHAALGFSVRYAGRRGFVELYNDHGYEANGDLVFDGARFDESDARPVDLGAISLGGYRWRWGFAGGVAW